MKLIAHREDKYVAIKVSVSKSEDDRGNREAQIMKKLAASHPSPQHVMCMLDDFNLEGPNGTHKCLVFELLGPSVPDIIETHFSDGRLPGNLAKDIAKQTLTGLDTLHQHNIGHGGRSHAFLTFGIVENCLNKYRHSHSKLGFYHASYGYFTRGRIY